MSRKSRSLFSSKKSSVSGVHIIVAAFFSLVSTGCMTSKREEELRGQLQSFEVRMVEMEKQIQLRDRTVDAFRNSSEESSRKYVNTKNDLDEVRRQLAMTQGAIDELRVKFARVQENNTGNGLNAKTLHDDSAITRFNEIEEWQSKVEKRLTKAELIAKTSRDQKGQPKQKLTVKTPAELAKVLNSAYAQKDFAKIVKFASTVIRSSNSEPMKTLAMEFRAEAHFQLQNYDRAAIDFMDIMEKYPNFERKPRALLLAGDSCVYLKQLRAAKAFYSECVRLFPDREECKASKERLARLGV